MSKGWQVSERFDAPVEAVWAALSDLPRASGWMSGVERLELIDGDGEPIEAGALVEGARYRFYARGGSHIGRVKAVEPGERLVLRTDHGGVAATYEYRLEDLGEGTSRVELHAWCDAPGIWRLFEPVLHFLMRKSDADQLVALRRIVHGAG